MFMTRSGETLLASVEIQRCLRFCQGAMCMSEMCKTTMSLEPLGRISSESALMANQNLSMQVAQIVTSAIANRNQSMFRLRAFANDQKNRSRRRRRFTSAWQCANHVAARHACIVHEIL